jgi:hypothetical protein
MFHRFLRHWLDRMAGHARSGPRRNHLANRPRRPLHLETLEGRCLPSTVTNLNDAGAGSLRQAIIDTSSGGTVDFQPGLSGTITLTTGELPIAKDLTISGPGAGVITVSGNQLLRVFEIDAGFTVDISGLTIAKGLRSGPGISEGGGIYNVGTLTIANSTLTGNVAYAYTISGSALGGAIANVGNLIVIRTTLTRNMATSLRALSYGGGIYDGGTAVITNSTLSSNSAIGINASGGAIDNEGALTVSNSTLSQNSASGMNGALGGGIGNDRGTVISGNSLVAGNTGLSPDVSGVLSSQGYNLIGDGTGGSGYADTDLVGTASNHIDPMVGSLQDNGGPTQTMALLSGSPALDAGDPAQLGMADQRGVVRSGGVNIGAYQASASSFVLTAPPKVTAGTPFDLTVTAVDTFGQLAVGYTGTVTFSTTDPDPRVVLPADYSFTLSDGGTHTFTDTGLGETTLWTRGYQTITATDTGDGSILGSVTVKVRHPSNVSPLPVFGGGLRSQWTDYLYVPEQPGQDAE